MTGPSDDEIEAFTVGGPTVHDGPIHLAEYEAAWPELFAREAERIRAVLRAVVVRLEHVGSTSVPGLAAKPIIDITNAKSEGGRDPARANARLRNGCG